MNNNNSRKPQTYKRKRNYNSNNNINVLTRNMAVAGLNKRATNNGNINMALPGLKKSVTFRQNKNRWYNIPKEAENVEARKSIAVNRTNTANLVQGNRNTPYRIKMKRNTYKNYLNVLRNQGQYHLEPSDKDFLNMMVGNKGPK